MLLTRNPYPISGGREAMLAQVISFLEDEYELSILVFTKNNIDLLQYKGKKVKKLFFPSILEMCKNFFMMSKYSLQERLFYSIKSKKIIEQEINEFKPDIIYADMIRTAQYVEKMKIKKIVDIEDLLSLRYNRFIQKNESKILGTFSHLVPFFMRTILENFFKNFLLKYEIELISRREKEIVNNFDACFLVSQKEIRILRNISKVNTIYLNTQAIQKRENIYNNIEQNNFVFIGNMCTAQNQSSLKIIVNEILPKLTIDYKLYVIGKYDNTTIGIIQNNNNIELLGFVENLEDILKNIKLALMPISFGTGIKTKILDCMSFGIPVLTNDVGNEGLSTEDMNNIVVVNNFSNFDYKLQEILNNKKLMSKLSNNGYKYVSEHHNYINLQKQFLDNISG